MVSALTDTPVKPGLAMTGEVTLRGRVLAIGGLRAKNYGGPAHGIKTVIVPAENEKDLEEIDQTVRAALHFILVSRWTRCWPQRCLCPAPPVSGATERRGGTLPCRKRAGRPSA